MGSRGNVSLPVSGFGVESNLVRALINLVRALNDLVRALIEFSWGLNAAWTAA